MTNSSNKAKRIVHGLFVTMVVLLLLESLPNPIHWHYRLFGDFWVWPGLVGAVSILIASFAGAYVAKTNFVGPAAAFSMAWWGLAVFILYQVSLSANQSGVAEIAATNLLGLLLPAIGAAIGAKLGRWFFLQREHIRTQAA